MILYNHPNGILFISILFILSMYYYGKNCPCNELNTTCIRKEFYGVQLSHFIFFAFLGFVFPSYFFVIQCLGILFELFEYYLDKNNDFVIKYINGCLMKKPKHKKNNPVYNYSVYRNIPKYVNPIDKFFEIKNSTLHGWHGSVAEVILNIFGFLIGYFLNKILIKYNG